MTRHLFLTGDRQVGKSTLLRKWLSEINCRTGGFYTRKVPEGEHIYVRLFPAARADDTDGMSNAAESAEDNILFDCTGRDAVDFTERFDRLGCPLLEASAGCDLIIMDEIGVKENRAEAFRRAVMSALDGPAPVIGVLRKLSPGERDSSPPGLVDCILERPDVSVIEVTEDNRDVLAATLPDTLLPFAKRRTDG